MRTALPAMLLLALTACAPAPQPPPAQSATAAPADPRDPQVRAQAVEQATLDAKQRQDEALEKQGG